MSIANEKTKVVRSRKMPFILFGSTLWRVFNDELKMTESQELLADYTRNGSETAFRELVTRYFDLVYSAAIRLVGGDTHWAKDVAQTVFVDLARMARGLPGTVMLGGWLHRHTCFVAAKTMRGERRRQSRERQAVEMNALHAASETNLAQAAPFLDEAINQLGPEDRTAILLRFFEQRDFRSVGEALGNTEDAARMRVNRALEKLRFLLKNQGVTFSATGLAAVLGAEAVTAAPAGLAAGIAGSALASVATGGGTLIFIRTITMAKLKTTLIIAAAAAGIIVSTVLYQANQKLRAENRALLGQNQRLTRLQPENARLAQLLAQAKQHPSTNPSAELLRLRAAFTRLRNQLAANSAAQAPGPANPSPEPATNNDSLKPFTAALKAHVGEGQTLIAGGWSINPGKHTFLFLMPKLNDSNSGGSGTINLRSVFIDVPDEVIGRFGLDGFKSDGRDSAIQNVLDKTDAETLLSALKEADGVNLLTAPQIETEVGRQSQVSVGDNPDAHDPATPPGISLNFLPTLAEDNKSLDVSIQTQIQPPPDIPPSAGN